MWKQVRWLERRWKLSGLAIDKEILLQALADLRSVISTAKVDFTNSKIVEKLGRSPYLTLLIHSSSRNRLFDFPSHDDLLFPLENFGKFFLSKFAISGLVSCHLALTWNLSIR